ncbi:MAG: bifunctional YncE family protein/alkaline phosphatase family protein [Myxococcales bacterium]|nr:bifunctional YncE family protein/alkaline phosphatase family protein [Myxococcales bacterium]
MSARLTKCWTFVLCVVAAACDDQAPIEQAMTVADAARAIDARLGADASPDAMPDATADAMPDAMPDAIADAQVDAAPDYGPPCLPDPPAEALRRPGALAEGTRLTPEGREAAPAGPNVVMEGTPTGVRAHPDGRAVYLTTASRDDRDLVVLDPIAGTIVQTIERDEAFFGLAISPDGNTLYASAGVADRVDRFAVREDGTLEAIDGIAIPGMPSGLALSPDGTRLWVGLFAEAGVVEVDTEAGVETRRVEVPGAVWDVVYVPTTDEVYASDLAGSGVAVVDLDDFSVAATVDVPTSPAGMAVAADGTRLYIAVSGTDAIASVDPLRREVVAWTPVAGTDWTDAEGAPLPNSNVNALALDDAAGRLYATRGADNAVSVIATDAMTLLGELPTARYPADVTLVPGVGRLVVAEAKGGGAGPNDGEGAKERIKGSATFVDLAAVDLEAASARAAAAFARPTTVWQYECPGRFPIPTRPTDRSPIEHVIVVVKENKTFDCVFGDLDPNELDVDVDPSLLRWGETITPNLHALARQYCIADNFHTEVLNSDEGHLLLTSMHLTEYVERIWIEKVRSGVFQGFQLTAPAVPDRGNLFTHLIDHGVGLQSYGEIVGMLARTRAGQAVIQWSDAAWPGGPAVNFSVRDEDKVRYLIRQIERGQLAPFTYVALPDDHTQGTDPGFPIPESMVADSDYAVGLLVEAVSRSPFWRRTAIFVVPDDTQGCEDHLDAHRSYLIAIGPWARRGHVSHVHGSFVSIFATIERIFAVPPLGRPDASAMPLWDCFTNVIDDTPYTALPRNIAEEFNPEDGPGAEKSRRMDWRSPDRNPGLGIVLDAYRLWKMGRISRAEATRRIDEGPSPEQWEALIEESYEESHAFDRDWAAYQDWRRAQGLPPARLFGRRAPPIAPSKDLDDDL